MKGPGSWKPVGYFVLFVVGGFTGGMLSVFASKGDRPYVDHAAALPVPVLSEPGAQVPMPRALLMRDARQDPADFRPKTNTVIYVITDPVTNCQYLSGSDTITLTPRLWVDGRPMCGPGERPKP